jgi:hypothetical protein
MLLTLGFEQVYEFVSQRAITPSNIQCDLYKDQFWRIAKMIMRYMYISLEEKTKGHNFLKTLGTAFPL